MVILLTLTSSVKCSVRLAIKSFFNFDVFNWMCRDSLQPTLNVLRAWHDAKALLRVVAVSVRRMYATAITTAEIIGTKSLSVVVSRCLWYSRLFPLSNVCEFSVGKNVWKVMRRCWLSGWILATNITARCLFKFLDIGVKFKELSFSV